MVVHLCGVRYLYGSTDEANQIHRVGSREAASDCHCHLYRYMSSVIDGEVASVPYTAVCCTLSLYSELPQVGTYGLYNIKLYVYMYVLIIQIR